MTKTWPTHASEQLTLGDGGIETALESRLGQHLPEFAAFVLLGTVQGRAALREYYRPYIEFAAAADVPLLLDTPTWRANPEWIALVDGGGEQPGRLASLNADAVALVRDCALGLAPDARIEVNGVVGPRFDEFVAAERMSAADSEEYHGPQVRALAEAGADRVSAVTTLDAAEGIGVVRAAVGARVPAVVSFTVDARGLLADGSSIADAIRAVDTATAGAALGFAVNCAHPEEVARGIAPAAPETARLIGFRLNVAREGEEGAGDGPEEFARAVHELSALAPTAKVLGGCCGTDAPHISAVLTRARRG
ncbi:homocysteine S-methyltransferase family protein [Leucobacter sp. BZR 635]